MKKKQLFCVLNCCFNLIVMIVLLFIEVKRIAPGRHSGDESAVRIPSLSRNLSGTVTTCHHQGQTAL
jgi:hypothetical protein